MALMSTRSQRLSGSVIDRDAVRRHCFGLRQIERFAVTTMAGLVEGRRKRMVAPCDAARHLDIDDAVPDPVSRDHLMQHHVQRR